MYTLLPFALLRVTFAAPLLLAARVAPAAPGDLDTTFGTGGKVTTVFVPNSNFEGPNAVVVQPDGKILVMGLVTPNPGLEDPGDFGLMRYLPDGSLDQNFGTGGKVITNFGGADLPYRMILQPDGRIFLAGFYGISHVPARSGVALVRYLPNGQLDPDFGTGGKVTTAGDGMMGAAFDGVRQPDGTFLLSGGTTKNGVFHPAVARYSTGGVFDDTFGTDGFALFEGDGTPGTSKIALQGTDRFIVANRDLDGGNVMILFRFDTAGHPDTTFGNGGKLAVNAGSTGANIAGLVVLSDRKILLAGYNFSNSFPFSQSTMFLLRFLPDGAPDSTFGTGGRVLIPPPDLNDENCNGLVLQPDGAILLAASGGAPTGFRVVRFHPDGSLDASFGTGGRVSTPGDDQAFCLALQSDGKVVVAGTYFDASSHGHFELRRYEGTPVLAPLETWRQKWFGITTNSGSAADDFDYDGDGLPNLLEWATGLDPTSRKASPAAVVLNAATLTLTYPFSDTALNSGTTLTVEWTDDLSGPWQTTGVTTSVLTDDGNLRQMQATLPAGISGRRFLRLRASRP